MATKNVIHYFHLRVVETSSDLFPFFLIHRKSKKRQVYVDSRSCKLLEAEEIAHSRVVVLTKPRDNVTNLRYELVPRYLWTNHLTTTTEWHLILLICTLPAPLRRQLTTPIRASCIQQRWDWSTVLTGFSVPTS